MERNISEYYKITENYNAHKNVTDFLSLNVLPSNAIDLGCGAGRDTIALIKKGWNVLAIDKEMRGKNLGKTMLEEFKNSVKERKIILLEAENPDATDDEQEKLARNKRISFYERLGFKVTENLKYLLVNIDYKILYYCLDDEEKIIDTDEVIICMRKVYDGILRDEVKLVMENLSKK